MPEILIENRHAGIRPDPSRIHALASVILDHASVSPQAELSILLLDDPAIAELNLRYRDKQGPTDVLSFPMHDPETPPLPVAVLGDVVISLDTARRQADEQQITLLEELAALLTHGILHLVGYDHERGADDARDMQARERAICLALRSDARTAALLGAPA